MNYYKFMNGNKSSVNGHEWHMPKNGKPGKWMPKLKTPLVLCENGYHACREQADDLLEWCNAPDLYRVELRGEIIAGDDKVAAQQARLLERVETWNERNQRLFACDCAERALKLLGDKADPRSIEAVQVARLFALGKASREELAAEYEWQFKRLMMYLRGEIE